MPRGPSKVWKAGVNTYVILIHVDDRLANRPRLTRRAVRELLRTYGVKLTQFYLLASGSYDALVMCEAPDNRSVGNVLNASDAWGKCSTEAMIVRAPTR